jgi:hypothetical protein
MRLAIRLAAVPCLTALAAAQTMTTDADLPFVPEIPRAWDASALAELELPLADQAATPQHLTPAQYYGMPVRPIYRSYPIYHPDAEPPGYFEELQQRAPELAWDRNALKTRSDWRRAGELVFEAPIVYDRVIDVTAVRDRGWYEMIGVPSTADGIMPFGRYVVREKGKVEVGAFSCAMCHTRVMPDRTPVPGAQGNFPFERAVGQFGARAPVALFRRVQRLFFEAPWIPSDEPELHTMPRDEVLRLHAALPPGVVARQGAHPRRPTQTPDLIGVRHRDYLDHTAVQRQRDIGDLMRYIAINQGASDLASYAGFRPIEAFFGRFPDLDRDTPGPGVIGRYSDAQLWALATFVYSLEPPANPNRFDDAARRGRTVFEAERCDRCHPAPHYTNNRLTPALGFEVPDDHPDRDRVMPGSVGTDAGLALRTRRGTGLYKVPSLKGVWYRSAFGHDGAVTTLEQWFDRRRLAEDFVPSGWLPPGVHSRAVRGHEFGLDLSAADRTALIAFLRTL